MHVIKQGRVDARPSTPSPVWVAAGYCFSLPTGLLVFGCSLQQPSVYMVAKVICLKAHLYPLWALLPTGDSGT